jgi:hypothetical protein
MLAPACDASRAPEKVAFINNLTFIQLSIYIFPTACKVYFAKFHHILQVIFAPVRHELQRILYFHYKVQIILYKFFSNLQRILLKFATNCQEFFNKFLTL